MVESGVEMGGFCNGFSLLLAGTERIVRDDYEMKKDAQCD